MAGATEEAALGSRLPKNCATAGACIGSTSSKSNGLVASEEAGVGARFEAGTFASGAAVDEAPKGLVESSIGLAGTAGAGAGTGALGNGVVDEVRDNGGADGWNRLSSSNGLVVSGFGGRLGNGLAVPCGGPGKGLGGRD